MPYIESELEAYDPFRPTRGPVVPSDRKALRQKHRLAVKQQHAARRSARAGALMARRVAQRTPAGVVVTAAPSLGDLGRFRGLKRLARAAVTRAATPRGGRRGRGARQFGDMALPVGVPLPAGFSSNDYTTVASGPVMTGPLEALEVRVARRMATARALNRAPKLRPMALRTWGVDAIPGAAVVTNETPEQTARRRQAAFMWHRRGGLGMRRAMVLSAPGYGLGDLDASFLKKLKKSIGAAQRSVRSTVKVAGGVIGFKKGLTAKQLKRASTVRKGTLIVGGAAAAIITAGAVAPALIGKVGAVGGKLGIGKLLAIGKGIQSKISTVRKALGLPPITLARRKQAEEQVAAEVEAGATPEQAQAHVEQQIQQEAVSAAAAQGTLPPGFVMPGSGGGSSYTPPAAEAVETAVAGAAPAPARANMGAAAVAVLAMIAVGSMLSQKKGVRAAR